MRDATQIAQIVSPSAMILSVPKLSLLIERPRVLVHCLLELAVANGKGVAWCVDGANLSWPQQKYQDALLETRSPSQARYLSCELAVNAGQVELDYLLHWAQRSRHLPCRCSCCQG